MHETFAKAIAYEGWRDLENPQAFVTRILKNIALDGQRRDRIATFEHMGDLDALGLVDEQPGPELTVLSRDELRRLREIVARLPDQVRRVFTLRKVYGLAHKDIADRLGLSVSTVEKHLAKGLRICSEELAREEVTGVVVETEFKWRKGNRDLRR